MTSENGEVALSVRFDGAEVPLAELARKLGEYLVNDPPDLGPFAYEALAVTDVWIVRTIGDDA